MTEKFLSLYGINWLKNAVKDKLVEKMFLRLPKEEQEKILKEILSEINEKEDEDEFGKLSTRP